MKLNILQASRNSENQFSIGLCFALPGESPRNNVPRIHAHIQDESEFPRAISIPDLKEAQCRMKWMSPLTGLSMSWQTSVFSSAMVEVVMIE